MKYLFDPILKKEFVCFRKNIFLSVITNSNQIHNVKYARSQFSVYIRMYMLKARVQSRLTQTASLRMYYLTQNRVEAGLESGT